MKLAEALKERADIQERLSQLRSRLDANARVQEGEEPSEDPKELLAELDRLIARLETLIVAINLTNTKVLDQGESLTALIAKRDCLQKKIGIIRDFLSSASDVTDRASHSEIKIKSTVSVKSERKELDRLCEALRLIDTRIQQRNWLTDLELP